jgi:uncharacterized protein YdeI (YjbR/CyaY-like superfamily)
MAKSGRHLHFADRAQWRAWLKKHHGRAKEAWLVLYKKGARPGALTLAEAVEEALCFGWIDGMLRSLDKDRFLLRYSPRRPGSVWSANNIRRVEQLIRDGRMTEAGLEPVGAARKSGQWAAALGRENVAAIPPDLERALRRHRGGLERFRKLTASQRKQYFWWIESAKRAVTRVKRIQAVVDRVTNAQRR